MNNDFSQILASLNRARRVLVTTHVRPDGDALGSAAAMLLGCRAAGIDAQLLLLSRLPGKYAFLLEENNIPHLDAEAGWPPQLNLADFDTLLVVDTGTWSQLPYLKERTAAWTGTRLIVDHHQTQESWADHKVVDIRAAAAGELVEELLQQWQIPLDRATATALFVAIVSDTGWFQFSSTRPQTLRLAADLMQAGVDTDRLYQLLYQNERPQRVFLQTRAQASLSLHADGRLAVMKLAARDFQETHSSVRDTENLINIPLQIRTVEMAILAVEEPASPNTPPHPIKFSFRSKGLVNVAKFAEQFGGGGHARASGAKSAGPLDAALGRIVPLAEQALAQVDAVHG